MLFLRCKSVFNLVLKNEFKNTLKRAKYLRAQKHPNRPQSGRAKLPATKDQQAVMGSGFDENL
jgi:hypothetical protein